MKKFSLIFLLGFGALLSQTQELQATTDKMRLFPKIENIGIIPVQVQGRAPHELANPKLIETLGILYSEGVRATHRFRVVDDDLVASMWQDKNSREELIDSYDLDGFMNLVVVIRDDVIELHNRLLSPAFDLYLSESEVLPLNWALSATKQQLYERIREFCFRFLNRLPIDMIVLSVQGSYVTLSGGKYQGVDVENEYSVVRPFVAAVNPADGTWLKFANMPLGKVKIVEVKQYTSVGLIVSQAKEGAIEVGDGVKIHTLAAREYFEELAAKPEFIDAGRNVEQSDVILPPRYIGSFKPKKAFKKGGSSSKTPIHQEDLPKKESSKQDEMKPLPSAITDGEDVVVDEPTSETLTEDSEGFELFSHTQVDQVTFQAGIYPWSVTGGGTANSILPIYLMNYWAVSIQGQYQSDVDYSLKGFVTSGPTTKGSFKGMGAELLAYYKVPVSTDWMRHLRLGGELLGSTIGVLRESYGGQDALTLGGFVGPQGNIEMMDRVAKYYFDVFIRPLSMGSAGVAGKKRSFSGFFEKGARFSFVYPKTAKQKLAWGGYFEYASTRLRTTKNLEKVEFKLLVQAIYQF